MTSYQKKWVTAASIFLIIYFGLLIWGALRSDSDLTITQAIQNADTTNVTSIVIEPNYSNTNRNQLNHALTLKDKNDIYYLLTSLKTLTEKNFRKGTEIFWDRTLILNFDNKYENKLKDKSRLAFEIFDSKEGFFVQRQNTFGAKTYSNNDLRGKLKKLTDIYFSKSQNK